MPLTKVSSLQDQLKKKALLPNKRDQIKALVRQNREIFCTALDKKIIITQTEEKGWLTQIMVDNRDARGGAFSSGAGQEQNPGGGG